MSRKEPWFKFWAADYIMDSRIDELPLEAQGLLVRMWCVCSQRGNNIPQEPGEIARLTRCKLQDVLKCHLQCKRFFKSRNKLLYSERMELEKAKSEKARANAYKRHNKEACAPEFADGTANGTANGNARVPAQKAREPESQGADGHRSENPSCAKRERSSDVRHSAFKNAIKTHWDTNNPGIDMPWGGAEGQALAMWLREVPNITLGQFTEFLSARFRSEVNRGERPSQWIRSLTKYGAGPIDRFGKSIKKENSNGTSRPSITKERIDGARRVLAEIAVERGLIDPARVDGGSDAPVSKPGPGGECG